MVLSIVFSFVFLGSHAQTFDPVNPDESLLMEMVIRKINEKRAKRKMNPLVLNAALQKTADQYIEKYKCTKFENNDVNQQRIRKRIKKNCQLNGYKNAYLDFQIASQNAMNYYGSRYYYDRDDTETSTHLFLGDKPSKAMKEDGFKQIIMKTFDYEEIATIIVRLFVRDDGYFNSLNNGYDKFGFSLAIDQKSLYRKRIPKLKILLILGGSRISW